MFSGSNLHMLFSRSGTSFFSPVFLLNVGDITRGFLAFKFSLRFYSYYFCWCCHFIYRLLYNEIFYFQELVLLLLFLKPLSLFFYFFHQIIISGIFITSLPYQCMKSDSFPFICCMGSIYPLSIVLRCIAVVVLVLPFPNTNTSLPSFLSMHMVNLSTLSKTKVY